MYAHANPVMNVDPTGEFATLVGLGVGFATYSYLSNTKNSSDLAAHQIIIRSLGAGIAGFLVARTLQQTRPVGAEKFSNATARLEKKLVATQTTASGKAEARRISDALLNTWESNMRWQLPSIARMERQKGIFCAEWVAAFRNASAYEIAQSPAANFRVQYEAASVPGDYPVHFWIAITPVNGGPTVYVDDGFYDGTFTHDSRPVPFGYVYGSQYRALQEPSWIPPAAYDSSGSEIIGPNFTGWHCE